MSQYYGIRRYRLHAAGRAVPPQAVHSAQAGRASAPPASRLPTWGAGALCFPKSANSVTSNRSNFAFPSKDGWTPATGPNCALERATLSRVASEIGGSPIAFSKPTPAPVIHAKDGPISHCSAGPPPSPSTQRPPTGAKPKPVHYPASRPWTRVLVVLFFLLFFFSGIPVPLPPSACSRPSRLCLSRNPSKIA